MTQATANPTIISASTNGQDTRNILVVSGDYEVVQGVRRALDGEQITVQAAYSHLDARYQMLHQRYDALLVDTALKERSTGERSLKILRRLRDTSALIVYQSSDSSPVSDLETSDVVTGTLEERALRRVIFQALRLPVSAAANSVETRARTGMLTQELPSWRADEVQTLFALSRSLTEVLDLSEVLNRVVEAARYLTNAEEGMILLPDKESGELLLRAKVGIDTDIAQNFRVRTQDSIAGTVYSEGEPILVGDSGPQKVKTSYFVNALLYVPILLKGRPIGVLGVNNKKKHDSFTHRHQELLLNLAFYAAIAIENAQSHGQLMEQAHELQTLVDASERINTSLKYEHTLPVICEQMVRVLKVTHAEILEWDTAERVLRRRSFYRRSLWKSGEEPQPDRALVTTIIRGELAWMYDEAEPIPEEGMRARLVLPILLEGRAFGAVVATYQRGEASAPADEAISQAKVLGFEMVVAVQDVRDRRARINGLEVSERLRRLLDATLLEIVIFRPETNDWRTIISAGKGTWVRSAPIAVHLDQFSDVQRALETQAVINVCTQSSDLTEGQKRLLERIGCGCMLALPLVSRGTVLGLAVFGDSEHPQPFSAREVDLARTMVGQAATAWENARLLHELEASLQELKETQARLIQTERLSAMGELAAAVAHQINNPLTTIVLDTELLLLNTGAETPTYESLAAIQRAGKRAANVVHRLLASVHTNAPDVPRQPIDVSTTLEETVALVRSHLRRAQIALVSQLPEQPLPPVLAVPGELDDVWLNLLLNAHDALQNRPNATMGLNARHDAATNEIEVIIWDNGPGIPAEIQDEIFKPFFTTKPIGEGTGLGLHICRQVVERVGGRMWLETVPEQGARFAIRLPVYTEGA